jgi:hypothetical protein
VRLDGKDNSRSAIIQVAVTIHSQIQVIIKGLLFMHLHTQGATYPDFSRNCVISCSADGAKIKQ